MILSHLSQTEKYVSDSVKSSSLCSSEHYFESIFALIAVRFLLVAREKIVLYLAWEDKYLLIHM